MTKFFIILFIIFPLTAFACPFADSQLPDLADSSYFTLGAESHINFPASLFKAFEQQLSSFDTEECRDAISFRKLLHKPTSQQFFVISTNQDRCDGGNTYGLILVSEDLKAENVVGVIQDSFIFCQ